MRKQQHITLYLLSIPLYNCLTNTARMNLLEWRNKVDKSEFDLKNSKRQL